MTDFQVGARATFGAAMSVQPFISAAVGLAIVVYILHRLFCCATQYTRIEQVGMSMTAAGMVMATPALWMPDTPFDGWSFNVARVGIAIYILTGGLRRDRHRRQNLHQRAYAEGYRDGRVDRRLNP